jgi:hypothetical protein
MTASSPPPAEPRRTIAADTAPGPRPVRRRRGRPSRAFPIGHVLGSSFSIWFTNLVPFLLLSAAVFALMPWWSPLDIVLASVFGQVVSAALIFSVFERMRGKVVPMSTAIRRGITALPTVIALGLVLGLVMVVAAAPILVFYLLSPDDFTSGATPCVFLLVQLACGIAVMYLTCGLYVAVPACVVERPGIVASLRRSWHLTNGSKWRIFLLSLLLGVMSAIVLMTASAIVATAGNRSVFDGVADHTYVETSLNVVFGSLSAVVAAVAYHELRQSVDGVDADELAAVFE